MEELDSEWDSRFRNLGIQSPGPSIADLLRDATDWKSALGVLRTAWETLAQRTRSIQRRQDLQQQLDRLIRCERQVSEAWKEDDARIPILASNWLGSRPWWWFAAIPDGRRVAIVSSRLPRQLNPSDVWLQALRATLAYLREQQSILVTGHGTAGQELVTRGAARLEVPTLLLRCCESARDEHWSVQWKSSLQKAWPAGVTEGWALPSWNPAAELATTPNNPLWQIPERDRATIAWADEVIVLGLRSRGNLDKLLRHRLAVQPGAVRLVDLPGLQPKKLRAEMVQLGAELWSPGDVSFSPANRPAEVPATRPQGRIVPLPVADSWAYLSHATRACEGPWPGQSQDDYLDSLLDARTDSDHSPLGTLLRIIQQRSLRASAQAIRGGYPVVSFTAVPLVELPRLRTFRAHRARWDFQPYGICIRRSWLEERGCRAVRYGADSDWQQLGESERPFFQALGGARQRASVGDDVASRIDWSVECEWRFQGDINLGELSADDALVFVPTLAAAEAVVDVSPWPVTVLDV